MARTVPFGLGRDRDLIHGCQRPDDVHRSADGILDDHGGRDRLGHTIAALASAVCDLSQPAAASAKTTVAIPAA